MKTILVVDDEKNMRWALKSALKKDDFTVLEAADGEEGLTVFLEAYPDLVLLDLKMPKMNGMEVMERMLERRPEVPIIMMTAHGSLETAVEAMRLGALDYITKPFDLTALQLQIRRALKMGDMASQIADYRERLSSPGLEGMIGESASMQAVFEMIERVAGTSAVVLITGESGTGKEVVADAIYAKSDRADQPLIKVNCGAIPETLIESELFGHEKGAFTGAHTRKPGKFERADGGTIFLDEIGELPADVQVKLLRVLQNKEFERVGGVETLTCDIRILAATNKDLKQMVAEKKFREDLFYRLNVVPIHLPPLRARRSDIPLLGGYFIDRICREMNRPLPSVPKSVWSILMAYDWPGNIRELQNVIERMLILSSGDTIHEQDIPMELRAHGQTQHVFTLPPEGIQLEDVEKSFIEQALQLAEGNQTKAAKLLGITRHTLLYRLDKYSIEAETYK